MDGSGIFDGLLLVRATAAAGLANTAVDVIRMQRNLYSWVPPLAALLLSFVILVLLSEANGVPINSRQSFASALLGAFIAAPLAIAATAVQATVERKASDQKVAEVQDAAQAQHERTVQEIIPAAARIASQETASNLTDMLAEAARRGALQAIEIAKSTPAA
jgi:mannose/fructose/N-acetylgalactosamine-specific phosphotransferase system component IID